MSAMWVCQVTGRPVDLEECLSCARSRYVPECPLDAPILAAMASANEEDQVVETLRQTGFPVVRVSSLTGCPLAAWYREHGFTPGLEPPMRFWARTRGTVFHRAFEQFSMGRLTEKRVFLFLEEPGAFVTGRVDGYDPTTHTLVDYKTTAQKMRWDRAQNGFVTPKMREPRPHHVDQVKIYAWLLSENGYPVQNIRIVYVSMGDIQSFDVEAPDREGMEQIRQSVVERVKAIVSDFPPDATPPEDWYCKFCEFYQCPRNDNPDLVAP